MLICHAKSPGQHVDMDLETKVVAASGKRARGTLKRGFEICALMI